MSYTNKTPNYELPQYVADDKPTYLGDFNKAMLDIDTALKNSVDKATASETLANNANSTSSTALATANEAKSEALSAQTKADSATTVANNAQTDAQQAISNASEAKTLANTASTNASSAVNSANEAKSTAQSAQTTANSLNQEVLKLKGTVLFTGSETGDVTLSDNAENYDEIKIFYENSSHREGSVDVLENTDNISLNITAIGNASFIFINRVISVNGNKITTSSNNSMQINQSGNVSYSSSNDIMIKRVVGYNWE